MLARLWWVIVKLLIAIDQVAHVLVAAPFYVFGLTDDLPDPDETISSRVGRYSIRGDRWAKVAEYLIDLLFFWQTDEHGRRNHCRRSVEARECAR
ncbi:hypothetical protein [Brevundimonas sp. NPDC058933]|uniref:hypothetical protein n=1 Tax=Brevundimonas sp. NPDC058933 TaxID=3346673 RepID=UPI003BEEB1A1